MKKIGILLSVILFSLSPLSIAKGPQTSNLVDQIEGVISYTNIESQQIVVDGITVQLTSNTLIKIRDEMGDFDDLIVGRTVKVCGYYEGLILVAHQISVKYLGK